MDPRLLGYYSRELQHVREMGGEFAREFPKIAGRLGLESFECADPYVERLLEGFAFLAARVHLKMEAEYPRFTQNLLEMVYPHYLAPTPSMAVVQFRPDPAGVKGEGYEIRRGTALRSILGPGDATPCEYRTAQEVVLWPLEIAEAEYYAYARDIATLDVPNPGGVQGAIRLRLRATGGLSLDKLTMDRLRLYLRGGDELPMWIYQQLLADAVGVVARPTNCPAPWHEVIDRRHIGQVGFEDHQALLPYALRSFRGYRLLHEYFAMPQRFMFVDLSGLGPALRQCSDDSIDVIVLLSRVIPQLDNLVDEGCFALHCTPAINLFEKRADRIHLSDRLPRFHVVVDRTRPMDFEVYDVTRVVGHGSSSDVELEFRPFYSVDRKEQGNGDLAFFSKQREKRVLSAGQRKHGSRTGYVGSEMFLSLVDADHAPYRRDLRQLAVSTLCTNRDLPLMMPVGQGKTDFTLQTGGPVQAVRCLDGPTGPRPSIAIGEAAWRLISHLSLNYLSLVDSDSDTGAGALRELLSLYCESADPAVRRQISGVKSIQTTRCTRRVTTAGPVTFTQGLKITVTFDESAFQGTGAFLLGAVLDRFFAKYVSINSFTQTVVKTMDRGEVIRWPIRTGTRPAL